MNEYPEFERLKADARALASADALAEPHVLTPEQRAEWETWLSERPAAVRAIAERFPPFRRYWLDPPGQVVTIYSYDETEAEGVLLKVNVDPEWNPHVLFGRTVFGIPPTDLRELAPQAPERSEAS